MLDYLKSFYCSLLLVEFRQLDVRNLFYLMKSVTYTSDSQNTVHCKKRKRKNKKQKQTKNKTKQQMTGKSPTKIKQLDQLIISNSVPELSSGDLHKKIIILLMS